MPAHGIRFNDQKCAIGRAFELVQPTPVCVRRNRYGPVRPKRDRHQADRHEQRGPSRRRGAPRSTGRRAERQAFQHAQRADVGKTAATNPRRTHCIASRTTRCPATPRVRKECADQVMASGLHHRVPECLLTSWPRAILVASDRPLAGTSNIASGMPCVIPSTVARRISSARLDLSSGIACFVSGMYRDNRRQLAPRPRQSACMSKKRRRAIRARNISAGICVAHSVAQNLSVPREIYAEGPSLRDFFARLERSVCIWPVSGRQLPHLSGPPAWGDTRVKPKFMRGPRGLGLVTTAMTGAAGYVPSNSVLRRCTTSRIGGAPNSRLYSRLNCDALS